MPMLQLGYNIPLASRGRLFHEQICSTAKLEN